MRRLRLILWLAVAGGGALGSSGCGGPDTLTAEGRPDGQKIYRLFCASCHGPDGRTEFRRDHQTLSLMTMEDRSDAELRSAIESGRGRMPPWKGRLKDDEITAVVEYVKRLVAGVPARQ